MKKTIIYSILLTIVALPIIIFCIIWCFSLAKCEVLTLLHGNEFSDGYKDDLSMPNEDSVTEYWKVIKYSKKYAEVYYIIKYNAAEESTSWEHKCGDIYHFDKENGQWKGSYDGTRWSSMGTADDAIWPYWWHANNGLLFVLYLIPSFILSLIFSVCLYIAIRSQRRKMRAVYDTN